MNIEDHLAEDPLLARKQLEDPDLIPVHLRDFAWNYLHSSTEIEHYEIHSLDGDINAMRFAHRTPLIATIGGRTILRLRNIYEPKRIFIADGYLFRSDIRFSPDDATLFAVLVEGGIVERRTIDGSVAGRYFEDAKLSGRIALSDDGNRLIAFSKEDELLHFDLTTNDARSGEVEGASDFIGIWFLPDQKIGGLTKQGMWVVWDEQTLAEIQRQDLRPLHEEVKGLAFADCQSFSNGETLLAMTRKNNSIIVVSLKNKDVQVVDTFSFRASSLAGVHIRTSSEVFGAGKQGGELRDIVNNNALRMIRKNSSPVISSTLSREQNLVALGTEDGTTHVLGLELPSMEAASFFNAPVYPSRRLPGTPVCLLHQDFVISGLKDGSLAVFDSSERILHGIWKISKGTINNLCLSRDQRTLYCGMNLQTTGEICCYPVAELKTRIHMHVVNLTITKRNLSCFLMCNP